MTNLKPVPQPEATHSDDYYEILGVERDASTKEIRHAYKKLANTHHPDKDGDADIFKDIREAFDILSDPIKRAIYDEHGRFTSNETSEAQSYIITMIDSLVNKIDDLGKFDMVLSLQKSNDNNLDQAKISMEKSKYQLKRFEKNMHRSKNRLILGVFKKYKGIATEQIEALENALRMFAVAEIMLDDFECNFDYCYTQNITFYPMP